MLPTQTALPAVTRSTPDALVREYQAVRSLTEQLCAPLEIEDYGVQSMTEASPAKWHLAHTSWFFETFVLAEMDSTFRSFDPLFGYLFNSYYNALGQFWPRSRRGHLSRPTVENVYEYRRYVDQAMLHLLGDES